MLFAFSDCKPLRSKCRICGGELRTRSDDQDAAAIDQRHAIYYDTATGTTAGCNFFKDLSADRGGVPKIIELDGRPGVKEVSEELLSKLEG